MSKNELRNNVIAIRNALTIEEIERKSEAIKKLLFTLPEYQNANTIMAYVDFRNEVQTSGIIKDALAGGKKIAIPITDVKNKKLTPSLLHNFPGDLVPGTWGILEPRSECIRPIASEELDLVIIPGVAFDEVGNRLGYGGGFYDRFLLRTRRDVILLALAFELQIKPNVYPAQHDIPMQMVVTEERIMDFRALSHN